MSIIFVGNTPGDVGGSAANSTSATGRDSSYSPNSIRVDSTAGTLAPFLATFSAVPAGDVWLHFRLRLPDYFNSSADGDLVDFRDDQGTLVARVDISNGSIGAQAIGDTTVAGAYVGYTSMVTVTLDVKVVVGADITIEVYQGEALISTATAANTGGKGVPVDCNFRNFDTSQLSTSDLYYTEIIATDGEPTLGWRLATLQPSAAGDYSDLVGAVSNLLNEDDGLAMESATVGHKASWSLSAYNGPASPGGGVRAVVSKTHSTKGATGPQNIRPFLRIGGTDYPGPADVTPAGLIGEMAVWDQNPATAAAWATADFASMQQGIEIKA